MKAKFFKIPLRRDNANEPQQHYIPTILEMERWKSDFPNIEVEEILKEIVAWNENNAHRRKTRRGIRHHVWKWLNRANEQAPARPPGDKTPEERARARGMDPEEYRRQVELAREKYRERVIGAMRKNLDTRKG